MRIAAQIKPNKKETILWDILKEQYGNEWDFVGDGKVVLGGKNPDFINTNGKKLIIEMFGTYYHGVKHQKTKCPLLEVIDREDIYAKYGYRTLIVWEHELKDLAHVKYKIAEFCNGGNAS